MTEFTQKTHHWRRRHASCETVVVTMTTYGLHTVVPRLKRAPAREIPADHPHRQEGARRALNVIVAGLGIVVAAPVMALIAVAVKLTSPGPIFYRQTRV